MKTPFRCPVCNGQKYVPNGFYRAIGSDSYTSSDATPEPCQTCNSTGIVWDESEEAKKMVCECGDKNRVVWYCGDCEKQKQ